MSGGSAYMREKDYVVDDGIYTQDKVTFFRTERTSQRRIADTNHQDSHLYTCNMANDHFLSNGDQEIIPVCHPCSTFAFDAKLKPSLLGKNQLRDKLAKRYRCQWLLRKSVPSSNGKIGALVNELDTSVSESCHNSSQSDISQKSKKRSKRTYKDIERQLTAVQEDRFGLEKQTILLSAEEDNLNLKKKIDIANSIIKVKDTEMKNIMSDYSMKKSLETVILSRYEKDCSANENNLSYYKKILKDLLDIIMKDDFLEGHCAAILNKKVGRKIKQSAKEEAKVSAQEGKIRSLSKIIEKEYLSVTHKSGMHSTTKARHVFQELCNDSFLNGKFDDFCKKQYEDIIKKECPYNKAHKVCREMDLSGGVLNQSSINILRKVENLGKYGRGGYLCSTNKIKDIQKIIHDEMEKNCPYVLIDEDGIDGVKFMYTKYLDYVLKLFKLDKIVWREGNIKIAITLDGADLSRNIQHVTAGIKILDPRAVNPVTGIPIGLEGVQSREFCFPTKILLTKDTKTLYRTHFNDFFEWANKLNTEGVLDYKKFSVASPQDVSSFWKCIGRGGAAKRDENFCHCCAVKSSNIIVPNLIKCAHCNKFDNKLCYHHSVCDSKFLEDVKSELRVLLETHNHLFDREKVAQMTIKLDPNDVFANEDISNIDFEPQNDEDKAAFSNNLNHNLTLLGLSRRGNIGARRDLLRQHLEALDRRNQLEHAIEDFDIEDTSMILLYQAIPCVLHMENRVGEKMLKLLLIEGANERDLDKQATKDMIAKVNKEVNTAILGTRRRKANWSVNITKEGTIADQPMTNNHTRKIINNFEKLLPLCVSDRSRREKWIECIELWRDLVETARQKEDFSDEQIENFQALCDNFFIKWVALHKESGVGNYVHMIGAGHLSYYLRKWRNLYRYSQQGWEALNSQIKTVYFRRTQRGGHKGDGEFNSKVEPIAKWVQRNLFWKGGLDTMFEENN